MKVKVSLQEYLSSVENVQYCFHYNRTPTSSDVNNITTHLQDFIENLRGIYLSDISQKQKDYKYKLIFEIVSRAKNEICKENFEGGISDYWNTIIFSLETANQHISELHFKETELHYKHDINEKALPPKQTDTKTQQDTPSFTNNFDKITPTEIYKHFKAGLVEKGYLNEQELNDYLKTAFEFKTRPETLFQIKDAPNKAAIEAVFYKYYKNVAGKIHGKQKQYAALLGDYFEGYKTTTVSSNFSKSIYY